MEAAFAELTLDDAGARPLFTRLWDLGAQRGDAAAQAVAAAGMVLAIAVEYADYRGLHLWGKRLCTLAATSQSTDRHRWRVDAARLALPCLDDAWGFDADSEARAEALFVALREATAIPPDERLLLAKVLMDYESLQLDVPRIERLMALTHHHLHRAQASPRWQMRWWLLLLQNHEYFNQGAAAAEAQARAQALCTRHGLHDLRFELACVELTLAIKADDALAAERLFRELDALRHHVRPGRLPQGLRAQAQWLLRRGDNSAALERIELLLSLCHDAEVPRRDQGAYEVLRAYVLIALGRHAQAQALLTDQRAHQRGQQAELLEAIILVAAAVQAVSEGAAQAAEITAQALRRCAALRFTRFLLPLPAWASRLVEIGQAAGVEPEFLANAVRDRQLVPSDPSREDWPWRLSIRLLGGLQIRRDGLALQQPAGKAQRKPIELLKLLAAQGVRPMPVETVIDALWPSLEADAPRASFEMAVSRLRKLLDLPEAVRVADGQVGLNARVVWWDVAAFERLAAQGDAEREPALALYRGPLLGDEKLEGLLAQARARWAQSHALLVQAQAEHLLATGRAAAAIRLLQGALVNDPLNEAVHRALISACLQQGEQAEALRAYHRCRELLADQLGVAPSAKTRALVGAGSAAPPTPPAGAQGHQAESG